MLMLLAALSTCHGNAFGAWSGKQRQRKKKLAIYRSWPWISNCWLWDSNSGLSGIEPRALTTRPRRLGANLRRDATSRLLFLNQSVLADFDPRKKKNPHFKTRSLSGMSNYGHNANARSLDSPLLAAKSRGMCRKQSPQTWPSAALGPRSFRVASSG